MKNLKLWRVAMVMPVVLGISGCMSPDGTRDHTGTGVLLGGMLGAASGALIGDNQGRGGEGALIGGAVGALTGGLIGNAMDQQEKNRLREQAPATYTRVEQGQPLGIADIKALSGSGLSDEVIISQIQSTRTVFRLSSSDIIDLHQAGVSQRVIEHMINTASVVAAPAPPPAPAPAQQVVVHSAPPPPVVERVVVAPGPGYAYVNGEWYWNGRWVWRPGRWMYPPRPRAAWVGSHWAHRGGGWVYVSGYWR